jgi:hypothetical protein
LVGRLVRHVLPSSHAAPQKSSPSSRTVRDLANNHGTHLSEIISANGHLTSRERENSPPLYVAVLERGKTAAARSLPYMWQFSHDLPGLQQSGSSPQCAVDCASIVLASAPPSLFRFSSISLTVAVSLDGVIGGQVKRDHNGG